MIISFFKILPTKMCNFFRYKLYILIYYVTVKIKKLQWSINFRNSGLTLLKTYKLYFMQGVRHDVIKILNSSAIQCKFNRCLNNCIYRQRYCKIILLFQIRWGSSLILGILKSYWILYYKNIVFQICVDNLRSSAFGVATYLRFNGKFHTRTRTCTCAGSIKKNQAKTLRFVSVAIFLFQDF